MYTENISLMIMLETAKISPPPVVVTANITIKLTIKFPKLPDIIPETAGATKPLIRNLKVYFIIKIEAFLL